MKKQSLFLSEHFIPYKNLRHYKFLPIFENVTFVKVSNLKKQK